MIDTVVPKLKARRLYLKLTQRQVADRIGSSQAYYSKIEQGKRDPRLSTLEDVARALSLEVLLVPNDLVDAVNGLTGQGPTPERKPLFYAEPD